MNNYSEQPQTNSGKRALVGAFIHQENAHQAARGLRDEGFHKIWIGVTSPYVESDGRYNTGTIGTLVESEDTSVTAKFGRFLNDRSDGGTLTETLMRHGVSEAEAARIDAVIEPDNVLLTVDCSDHPELAARIVEESGGEVLSGESFVVTRIEWSGADGLRGSQMLDYEDPHGVPRPQERR